MLDVMFNLDWNDPSEWILGPFTVLVLNWPTTWK